VFILKGVKVLCFDILLQVFILKVFILKVVILKVLSGTRFCSRDSRVGGGECEVAARARRGWNVMCTALDVACLQQAGST
jgi:hypothetical protein